MTGEPMITTKITTYNIHPDAQIRNLGIILVPYSFMSHPCGGGCDEKPRVLSRNNEGFLLQLLRRLLEDSPQLSAPSGIALVEESRLMGGHGPFLGHLTPMTDE